MFLAEKNCTVVSHEISHEMLRRKHYKRYIEDVHDIWTKHLFSDYPFIQYDENFSITNEKPRFLAMNIGEIIDKNHSKN